MIIWYWKLLGMVVCVCVIIQVFLLFFGCVFPFSGMQPCMRFFILFHLYIIMASKHAYANHRLFELRMDVPRKKSSTTRR
jgi:hypothetical protein